jgi:hypothetical protein
MSSQKDSDSGRPLSAKALLIGLVVGCLVFTLSVFLSGIGAGRMDYSDPSVAEEMLDTTPSPTPQSDSVAKAQPSPAVATVIGSETTVHPKQHTRSKANAVAAAVKR